jgi:hypothetical protein
LGVPVVAERFLGFCSEHVPFALGETRALLSRHDEGAEKQLRGLVERYLELRQTEEQSPDEYQRLLKIEKMTDEGRALGKRIQELQQALQADPPEAKPLQTELTVAQAELRQLVSRIFVAEHQNQQIEVNRLEAEVRELQRLLRQREANRSQIIQQRLYELTGPGLGGDASATARPAGVAPGRAAEPAAASLAEP